MGVEDFVIYNLEKKLRANRRIDSDNELGYRQQEAFLEGRKWKGVLVNSNVGHDTERKSVNSFKRNDISPSDSRR